MSNYAWVLEVRPGYEEEYKKRHDYVVNELNLIDGVICKETGRAKAAIAHFADALASDPFMWSAYEELCALGAESEAEAGTFFLIIV